MQYTNELQNMVAPLLLWYRENKRSLPWRDDPTPYHVWVSEIMLQQTRIEAVIPYYKRFLSELPDIPALANCEEQKLMKLWEGLGYYSRVRNLQKAAVKAVELYDGDLPHTAALLKTMPGIGDYTAGAVASICFGEPSPAVDGNVLRVLSRYLADENDVMLPQTKKSMTAELAKIYPSGKEAGALTQALMELGQCVCIPNGQPKCDVCPLAGLCQGKKLGTAEKLPVKSKKKPRKIEDKTVLLLSCRMEYAISQRPKAGLLAGLYEFPNFESHLTEDAVREKLSAMGFDIVSVIPCGDAVHIFTHVEWHMTGYAVECTEKSDGYLWKAADEIKNDFAVPTAFKFYTNQLL